MSENKGGKEGFTLGLALMDAIPCIAFGVDMLMLSKPLKSTLFLIGALFVFAAGMFMVIYKLCLAIAKKEYPGLKKAMPIVMSAGWIMIIIALIIKRKMISFAGIWAGISSMPACIFFIAGLVSFIAFITYFKTKFNADSAKDNWVEEILNALTQTCFMIGVILATM